MGKLVDYIVNSGRKVSSRELNHEFCLDKDDSGGWPRTRQVLKQEIRETNSCIGADTSGYFVIKTNTQLRKYVLNLNDRISGIEERISLALNNFSS